MAINPLNRSTPLRIMGIASGLDTDLIIQQSLRIHQLKIDSQFRARTTLQWRQQALNGIKDQITDFRRSFLTTLGQTAMRLSNTYNPNIATLSGKNAGAVSIATSINSPVGTLRIGQIASLAKNTSVTSTGSVSRNGTGLKLTDKLGDIFLSNREVTFNSNGDAAVNFNGTDITLNRNDTIDNINAKIGAKGGNQIVFFDSQVDFEGRHFARAQVNGKDVTIYRDEAYYQADDAITRAGLDDLIDFGLGDSVNVTLNGATITLNKTDTLDVINQKIRAGGGDAISFGSDGFGDIEINGETARVYQGAFLNPNLSSTIAAKANVAGVDAEGKPIANFGGISWDVNGTASFTIGNGLLNATFEINKNMTIDDMLKMVNGSGMGVTMKYDRLSDQFSIESNTAGASTISVGGLQAFGIYNGNYNNGTVARVQINGEWVESNSNTIDFRGVKITLNHTTNGSGLDGVWTAEDDVVVTVKRDATEPLNKIKTFIEAYNDMIKKLEDMLRETKTRSEVTYKPLTDEEKAQMSDKQIEEWEAIAKKGLLRNDAGIQSLTNSLRNSLFEKIREAGLSPAQIGISTGRWDEGLGGQIVLDEAKLREALEEDPERVVNVFMGGANETNSADRGWLYRMEDLMLGYVNGSQFNSINNLENSIRRTNDQIEKLREKMYAEEDKLYRRFAALETAMSKIQQQSDWFSAMLESTTKK